MLKRAPQKGPGESLCPSAVLLAAFPTPQADVNKAVGLGGWSGPGGRQEPRAQGSLLSRPESEPRYRATPGLSGQLTHSLVTSPAPGSLESNFVLSAHVPSRNKARAGSALLLHVCPLSQKTVPRTELVRRCHGQGLGRRAEGFREVQPSQQEGAAFLPLEATSVWSPGRAALRR